MRNLLFLSDDGCRGPSGWFFVPPPGVLVIIPLSLPPQRVPAMTSALPRKDLTRREFLQGMTAAGLATLASGAPRLAQAGERVQHPQPTADTCILLWMAGGMAAPETFDPKRYTPFEVGVPEGRILCTFPSIPTAVDNIRISQGLENVASVMDRGTLIRSHHVADLGNI